MALVQAASALAGTPVVLRRDLSSGPAITLADLFDGAGAAGSTYVGGGAPAGEDAVLDADAVQRIAHENGLDWDNPDAIRRIIVRGAASSAADAPARASDAKLVDVLAYTRDLTAGDIVRPEDVDFIKTPAFAAPADAPRDASEIIGKVARQPLKAGSPAHDRDVSNAQVIKRNDLVQVAYRAAGISLVLEAKSMSAAAVGDVVTIMNTSSNKLIQGVAVGPDQAVVGPEAAALKAAAFPTPAQFADNR